MKNLKIISAPLLSVFLVLAVYLVSLKPVFLHQNGEWKRVLTHASSVAVLLRETGITWEGSAQTVPGPDSPIRWGMTIEVPSGRAIPVEVRGETRYVTFPEEEGASLRSLLTTAGIELEDAEWVFADGVALPPDTVLTVPPRRMEVRSAVEFLLLDGGETKRLSAPGPTVGEALWQAGVTLYAADVVLPVPSTKLESIGQTPVVIEIVRSRMLTIRADGKEAGFRSAGKTVGEALARAGFALTGLDYSIPAEADPLPPDGRIRVVRVREEILREQSQIPFERDTQPDAELELDQTKVIQPGAFGILESVVRVRWEDGREVRRTSEGQHVLLEPQTRIIGYGTRVVLRTVSTPEGTFEYYRAITVYATSYSPCRLGVTPPRCSYVTRSGMAMQKGLIAMVNSWYLLFHGQPVYVEGYGPATVADSGLGPNAPYWIDLAYLDDEYIGWHSFTTLYFLSPVPANVPWILP
ncbi:MAG: G5 domain-containing protein [Anaerolineales bacterium]|nr:G5 domain-containing protein [Anaerolineales bacterium]